MNLLDGLVPGSVRCVFSSAPAVTIRKLLDRASAASEVERGVVFTIDLLRPTFELPDQFVRSMAQSALTVWPDWYERTGLFSRCDDASWQTAFDHLESRRAASRHRSVLRPWLGRAIPLCRSARLPIIEDFLPALQLQQLALAISDTELLVIVGTVSAECPDPASLMGLARNLEWLSRHVPARIVTVLPSAWSDREELDSVAWECRRAEEEAVAHPDTPPPFDEPSLLVGPIRGRPHPNSPGEQLMASRLALDPALRALFEYNVLVPTVRGSRYRVDLVWFAGRLVVEIDGYWCHSSRADFEADRHRDYELHLSGYLVLRLTHDSVMRDVELALDKVRDLVKFQSRRSDMEVQTG